MTKKFVDLAPLVIPRGGSRTLIIYILHAINSSPLLTSCLVLRVFNYIGGPEFKLLCWLHFNRLDRKNGSFEMHKFLFYLFVFVVDYCYQEQSDCFSARSGEKREGEHFLGFWLVLF